MKVCFVAYYGWRRRLNKPTGDIVQLKSYIEALSSNNIDAVLYIPRSGGVNRIGNVPVVTMPYIPPPFSKYEILYHLQSLYLGFLDRKLDADIYHLRGLSHVIASFRHFIKKPLIATFLPLSLFGLKSKKYDQKMIDKINVLVTLSEAWRQYMLENFRVSENRVVHLPICVDINRFSPNVKAPELKERFNCENIIGYFGVLYWYQGIHVAVRYMPQVLKEHPDTKLIIGGEGPLRPYLESIIRKEGLENNVIFLGQIPHDELPKYFSITDMLVSPLLKRSEKYMSFSRPIFVSLKLLEFLSMGKPTIISDEIGIREVVGPDYELLIRKKKDLLDKMLLLLGDKGLRNKIGAKVRKIIEDRYSYAVVGKKAKELYSRFE
ncbi:MAG: glycosyltransferase family 4 protein [Candidatus Helarchaeales archaeon]